MMGKGKVLFVDDEKRVLNSMRGMFRRDYELFLTTEGAEAVSAACANDVDVVVADQRMPGMSGVEVLEKVREKSPRTVRILLTGYADPDAIQGSINVGEVFRFLSKPCPPALLRETLDLAIAASRIPTVESGTARPEARSAANDSAAAPEPEHVNASMAAPPQTVGDDFAPVASQSVDPELQSEAVPAVSPAAESPVGIGESRRIRLNPRSVGVVAFTANKAFEAQIAEVLAGERELIVATKLKDVATCLAERRAGVFLTDVTSDTQLLQRIIGALKQYLPELVAIVVSDSRDANDMIDLINYGQVYRYNVKPVETLPLRADISAAVLKHLQLVNHPELIQRHRVIETSQRDDTGASATLNRFLGTVTRLRGLWSRNGQPADGDEVGS